MAERLAILLLPQFSLLSYASVLEPLRLSNQLMGEKRFAWRTFGISSDVVSESGIRMPVDCVLAAPESVNEQRSYDLSESARKFLSESEGIIVCGGHSVPDVCNVDFLSEALKGLSGKVSWMAGVAGGSQLLLGTGLLNRRKVSISPPRHPDLLEHWKKASASSDLFSVDGQWWTCRGGSAALDMMLFRIARFESTELAELISQTLTRQRLGDTLPSGRMLVGERLRKEQPVLAEAVALMESNLEEPLSFDDISTHLGISRRQLERYFKKHLNSVPSRYYAQIRLEYARDLVLHSSLTLSEIALKAGYSSGAHFSTAYRSMFGLAPSEERS